MWRPIPFSPTILLHDLFKFGLPGDLGVLYGIFISSDVTKVFFKSDVTAFRLRVASLWHCSIMKIKVNVCISKWYSHLPTLLLECHSIIHRRICQIPICKKKKKKKKKMHLVVKRAKGASAKGNTKAITGDQVYAVWEHWLWTCGRLRGFAHKQHCAARGYQRERHSSCYHLDH